MTTLVIICIVKKMTTPVIGFRETRNEVIVITAKFYSLPPEKRERIINAAIGEFARVGYEKASTNAMVKEAEISKGSLFNYFNSKKELYLFLLEYIEAEVINKIYDEIDYQQRDLFERLREIGLIKFRIMNKYPQVFDFLDTVAREESSEIKPEIESAKKAVIENAFQRIYENIDWGKFRDDIDLKKTIDIINWTMLSFSEQQRNQLDSFENIDLELLREWDDYFEIMKRCFYKQEAD